MVKMQLSDAAKVHALGLIEDAEWSIQSVATCNARTLGVSRWTIMRLVARKNQDPDCEIPLRKKALVQEKSMGNVKVDAIERALETNPFLTSRDLKMRMPKTLKNIDGRTVRRIIREDLDRPARVAPCQSMTQSEAMTCGRVDWVKSKVGEK